MSIRDSRPAVKLITDVVVEPVSLADAYKQLRLIPDQGSPPSHQDDQWLTEIGIPAARAKCEAYTARSIGQKTFELALDGFTCWPARGIRLALDLPIPWVWPPTFIQATLSGIEIPFAPIDRILWVKYLDTDGFEQTLDPDTYMLDTYQEPSWLVLAPNESWPATQSGAINAVKIRYSAGYGLPYDSPEGQPLPPAIKIAILLTLGHLHENRENTTDLKLIDLPQGAQSFLEDFNLRRGFA